MIEAVRLPGGRVRVTRRAMVALALVTDTGSMLGQGSAEAAAPGCKRIPAARTS